MRKLDDKNNYIDGNCKQNKDVDSKIDESMKKRRRRIKENRKIDTKETWTKIQKKLTIKYYWTPIEAQKLPSSSQRSIQLFVGIDPHWVAFIVAQWKMDRLNNFVSFVSDMSKNKKKA